MDWILDNIQFVIAFVAAFVWWLNKRREQSAAADEESPPPMMMGDTEHEEAERTRRIQEEIRRKIAGRQTLPPVAPPPVVLFERVEPAIPPVVERTWAEPIEERLEMEDAMRKRQRQMEEQLRMIEETTQEAAMIRSRIAAKPARKTAVAVKGTGVPGWLNSELRNVGQVRRAIVLREILGPPKGLQR